AGFLRGSSDPRHPRSHRGDERAVRVASTLVDGDATVRDRNGPDARALDVEDVRVVHPLDAIGGDAGRKTLEEILHSAHGPVLLLVRERPETTARLRSARRGLRP